MDGFDSDIMRRMWSSLVGAVSTVWGTISTVLFCVAILLALFNQPFAEKLLGWEGFNPAWALVPVGAVFFIFFVRASDQRYHDLEASLTNKVDTISARIDDHGQSSGSPVPEIDTLRKEIESVRQFAQSLQGESVEVARENAIREEMIERLNHVRALLNERIEGAFITHDEGLNCSWRLGLHEILQKCLKDEAVAARLMDFRDNLGGANLAVSYVQGIAASLKPDDLKD